MKIQEFKPRKDIEAFYKDKLALSQNLSSKIEVIEEDIRQGKRSIDLAYLRIWANCNKTFNELNIYNLHRFKSFYDILVSYKSEIIKCSNINKKEIETCEMMIYAISDLFEVIYEFWQQMDAMCKLLLKTCDELEQNKSLIKELENKSKLQKTIETILSFKSAVVVYTKQNLHPILDEVEKYVEKIKRNRAQFGE